MKFNNCHHTINSVHRNLKAFECMECPASFSLKGNLKRHIANVHKMNTEESIDKNQFLEKSLKKETFKDKDKPKKYVKTNHSKTYNCHICETNFSNKSLMKEHYEFAHRDLKTHCCKLCGKNFYEKSKLDRHIFKKHHKN